MQTPSRCYATATAASYKCSETSQTKPPHDLHVATDSRAVPEALVGFSQPDVEELYQREALVYRRYSLPFVFGVAMMPYQLSMLHYIDVGIVAAMGIVTFCGTFSKWYPLPSLSHLPQKMN